jgi:hypothetical protein
MARPEAAIKERRARRRRAPAVDAAFLRRDQTPQNPKTFTWKPHGELMSAQLPLLTSILEIHSLSSGARITLFALLSFRNKETGQCNPRITTLSERLGAPYGTVRCWLRELRLSGAVEMTKHRGSNSYRIDPSKSCGKAGRPKHRERLVPDAQERLDFDAQERRTFDAVAGSVLIEQTEENRQRRTCAAAVKTTGSVGTCEKRTAAAAQSSLFDNPPEPERPASPPVAATVEAEPEPDSREHDGRAQVVIPPPQAQIAELAQAMALELLKVHPQPGLGKRAAPEIERVLRAAPDVTATAERMWNNHAAWMQYWKTLEAGKFIPQLWRWLHDGDWEQAPVIRKPAERETKLDRVIRKMHEDRQRQERRRA